MGVLSLFSKSSYDDDAGIDINKVSKSSYDKIDVRLPNPDPSNYKIVRSKQFKKYLAVMINYPNCTNYEGNKICVYECTLKQLLKQKKIDPHFSENKKFYSPIARFIPNENGWEMAENFCKIMLSTGV